MRCPWAGIDDRSMRATTTRSGACRKTDDRALFEKLVLEGFQAGLSWITILRKRENFRRAFHDFDAERIARYGAKDIARLMADAGIVRNRLKIEATIDNAKALPEAARSARALQTFLWDFLDGRPAASTGTRSFKRHPGRDAELSKAHLQGAEGGRLPLRRPDDGLCLHAVDRHGQRSSRRAAIGTAAAPSCSDGSRRRVQRKRDDRRRRPRAAPSRRTRAWQRMLSGRRLDLLEPVARRHRDRGHRSRACPRRALERPDGRRARLLGRPARAAGGGDRHRHATRTGRAAGGWRRCCTMRPST